MSDDRRKKEVRRSDSGEDVEHREVERRESDDERDRRKEKRVDLELWIEEQDGEDKVFRRTGNVSAGGVYFDNALPHLPGKRLNLKIPLGSGEGVPVVRVWAEVVNERSCELGMGVKFLSFGADGEELLRRFLEESN